MKTAAHLRASISRFVLPLAFAAGCSPATAPITPARTGLTIRLAVPASTPAGAAVYVAGSFNAWNPADPAYRLTLGSDGRYAITLPDALRGPVEFKFTLGSWDRVELTASGGDVPNRTSTVPATGSATWEGSVGTWRDGTVASRPHTARPTVTVLSDGFAMPQLGRTRRVWLYLPPDYATTTKHYPVIYMHDGQNVFDAATSFAGEWGVDETLDSLQALGDWGAIVVAVDNGQTLRMDEYMPWPSALPQITGGGQGGLYVDFIVQTLKPYIDAHYRTMPERHNTGIGGSSLGGLISFYAAVQYPDVFGRVLAFSPTFFINPQVFALARAVHPRQPPTRYYMISGLEEGSAGLGLPDRIFMRSQNAMLDTLALAGIDTAADARSLLPGDGAHAEWFWRREFPAAYRWAFQR